SVPYYTDTAIFYIAYLIISSVQLGATVDYAILFTERYKENRETLDRKESIQKTVSDVTISILTSGTALMIVGFLLGKVSTHGLLSQLGFLLGKGTFFSLLSVLFVLPGLLGLCDRCMTKNKPRKQHSMEGDVV
ncbi:MAG: MMPL family transporter, partial [Wujia sp.]